MKILSLIFPSLSRARKLKADLTTRALATKPMPPIEPYTCVVDPKTCNDPRLLPLITVYGTMDTDAEFSKRIQTLLRSVCSITVSEERLPIAALDGCTASKSSPRERTLLAWGNAMDPKGLMRPFQGPLSYHLVTCLRHTFPNQRQARYPVDHLTWTKHGRYLRNHDGSHHLAYAVSLIHKLGVIDDHHIEVTLTTYRLDWDQVRRLEVQYGAYLMPSIAWYHVMAPLLTHRIPYARATLCHDRPIHDPLGAYFLDRDHPMTPVLQEVLDGLVDRGCACRLGDWLGMFRH